MSTEFWPGTRVLAFDWTLYRDDKSTPLSVTLKPATVERWHGYKAPAIDQPGVLWTYPNLVDVRFDHRPERISHSHFAERVEVIW